MSLIVWPSDCPNKPPAFYAGQVGHSVVDLNGGYGGGGVSFWHAKVTSQKYESLIVEHVIPGRESGIIQYLGSKARRLTIEGVIDSMTEYTNTFNNDPNSQIENLRSNTLTDITVKVYYGWAALSAIGEPTQLGDQPVFSSGPYRITDYTVTPAAGSSMVWIPYKINLVRKI